MGICDKIKSPHHNTNYNTNHNLERIVSPGFVPNEFIDNIQNSNCKISYKNIYGTGFFMGFHYINYLVTNYHIIPEELLNESIKLEFQSKSLKTIVLKMIMGK